MRVLWAPWRLRYVSSADAGDGCIFCDKPGLADPGRRREELVLYSDGDASVLMNLFPYASAHVMVSPRRHGADLTSLDERATLAVQRLIARSMEAISDEYRPHGFNVGMNIGRTAGAGIVDHLHWHVVPRWEGDTNFMPLLADTKVMPEHLEETYDRLRGHFV